MPRPKRSAARPKTGPELPPVLTQFARALKSLDVPDFSSDTERAQDLFYAALAAARKVNPHLEAYLNGRQRIPAAQPESYSPGSPAEAVCFAEPVRSAWSAHPDALRWLQSQG